MIGAPASGMRQRGPGSCGTAKRCRWRRGCVKCFSRPGRHSPMTTRFTVVLAALLVSCAHHASTMPPDSVARPASGVPTRFLYDGSAFQADSLDLHACRTPLLDPNDSAKLVMVRTEKGS